MAIEVAAAKKVVFNLVQESAHDAGGHVDLVFLEGKMAEFSDADLRLTILMKGIGTAVIGAIAAIAGAVVGAWLSN